jgi:tetratricopeptide (TPR) repeat protein
MFEHFREGFAASLQAHDDEGAASAALMFAGVLGDRTRQADLARDWLRIGRALLGRIGGRPQLEAWSHNAEAEIFVAEGKGAAAVDAYRQAYALKARAVGHDSYDTIQGLINIGLGLQAAGHYEDALAVDMEGKEAMTRLLGADHPMIAMASSNAGETLNDLGRYAEARVEFARAAAIWRRASADVGFQSYALTGLGLALLGEGKPAAAIEPLEEALRARVEKRFDVERLGETRFALARALWSKPAARDRALALAQQALADYAQVKTPTAPVPDVAAWLRAPSSKA